MKAPRLPTVVLIATLASAIICALIVCIHSAKAERVNQAVYTSNARIADSILTPYGADQSHAIAFTPALTVYLPVMFRNFRDCRQLTKLEAGYILACQNSNPSDPAYGAINNVYPGSGFTWIVPSEVAMATLGLDLASDILNDPSYRSRALLALDYLLKVQQPDGCWYNQYSGTTPHDDLGKSPHQTAQVMYALYKLDYYPKGYNAMKKGAQCLLDFQNVANKGGNDDGLLGAGKNPQGQFESWRWTHDNAWAYWAMKAAELWAVRAGDTSLASTYAASAQRILQGINTYLRALSTGVWHIAIDKYGNPQWFSHLENLPSWIQYAPQLLDLPAIGVNLPGVGEWIHSTFQQSDGSCIGYYWDGGLKVRKYPGLCFMAALCWYDTGHMAYANAAFNWALGSGLWWPTGGWIDWVEVSPNPGTKAPEWQRFIDTSFYAIATCRGGYDFRIP